jgi:homoserine dehydrogenase
VHPTLVPSAHPLASVSEEFNAVFVNAVHSRELMFYGPGAGAGPTGSALSGDVLDIARDIVAGTGASAPLAVSEPPAIVPPEEVESRHYVRVFVPDTPGTIGAVAQVLGRHNVSIAACHADRLSDGTGSTVWITHPVSESDIRPALAEIQELGPIYQVAAAIRIEE